MSMTVLVPAAPAHVPTQSLKVVRIIVVRCRTYRTRTMRRSLSHALICAGACAVLSIHLWCGPAHAQYVDNTYKNRYFKPIEFEKVHRGVISTYNTTGMFNISQCSIDLMVCLEDAPNDLVCSFTRPFSFRAYVDTICPLMRERCHDFMPTFQGPFLDFFEGACNEELQSLDFDYA